MPAQQGGGLTEEAGPVKPKEESPQSNQHSPIRRLQRRAMYLASEHRYFVVQPDHLDSEVGVLAE